MNTKAILSQLCLATIIIVLFTGLLIQSLGPVIPVVSSSVPRQANQTTILSTGVNDGWILESTESSGTGGSINKNASTLRLGDDANDRQYLSILSFDASTLPGNAVITSVTLKFKYSGVFGDNPFDTFGNLLADIHKSGFSNNIALQPEDFKATASKNKVLTFTNTPIDNWYSQSLDPADFIYIKSNNIIQFRLRFTNDDNDDKGADYLKIFSGDAGAANRPQLIIEYQVP